MDTHEASVVIDQVQSRAVVMFSDPWPPLAEKADGELLALTWHLSAVGAVIDVCVELHAATAASAAIDAAALTRIRQRIRFPQPRGTSRGRRHLIAIASPSQSLNR